MAAMTEAVPQGRSSDRQGRRRPFATLVKKLRSLNKGSSSSGGDDGGRHGSASSSSKHAKKPTTKKGRAPAYNNPYPESGRIATPAAANGNGVARSSARSLSTALTSNIASSATTLERALSIRSSADGAGGGHSRAPLTAATTSTDHDAARSIAAPSHGAASSVTGTSRTATAGIDSRRGGDSTFSSPAPSVRSLTTTLTTIQSMPMPHGGNAAGGGHQPLHAGGSGHLGVAGPGSIHFNQPFPSTPASAIPPHLAPAAAAGGQGGTQNPTTYSTATANGLLTDNASILTLASSSKRRRRRSLDTNASVRALPPSSLFGGSRESLPLSVLSATVDVPSMVYSTGAGAIAGDRSSFYAPKQPQQQQQQQQPPQPQGGSAAAAPDGASVRSGLLGHGRAESVAGSVGGGVASPLASPMEVEEQDRQLAGAEEEKKLKPDVDDDDEREEKEIPKGENQ